MLCLINNSSVKSYVNDPWESSIFDAQDAFTSRPATDFVVENLFSLPSLSIVYGTPATLKSFQLADLAVCVAGGKPWLEPYNGNQCHTFNTKQNCVYWLDFENGRRRTEERIAALITAHGLQKHIPIRCVSMPSPWSDSSNPDQMDELGHRVDYFGAKLLVVDNLGVVSGGVDENSNKMASVMANWRRFAEDHHLAVVLIHHQNKGYSKGNGIRAGASLRGHSSIEAALDLALLVERDGQSDVINVQSTKARDADVPPFSARFTYKHKPSTNQLEEARFWGVPATCRSSDWQIEQAILNIVEMKAGLNKNDLKKAVHDQLRADRIYSGVGIHKIEDGIDRLHKSGKLAMARGKNGAKVYSLPEPDDDSDSESKSLPDLQPLKISA